MKQIGRPVTLVRLLGSLVILAGLLLTTAADWPTFLHDNSRTGTNPDESTLTPSNVAQLAKQWSYTTGAPIAASPTIVGGTVYAGSWDGYEYALDENTGSLKWKVFLGQTTGPACDPALIGVTSAATVQNGVVYVGGGDAYWYALDAVTGSILWKVFTGDNSPTSGHYNWSSPLIYNGYAYIGIASNCDAPLVQGQLLRVDLNTHQIVNTYNAVPNGQTGGGIWTSPSLDATTNTIYVTTGTKSQDGQTQSQAVVALDATTLNVKSYWQLPDSEAVGDSDWGTTPILFTDQAGDRLVAATNKNGTLYAFNRNNLAAGPLWRFQIAIGGDCPICGEGTVSSLAFMDGVLYAASGNTTINGIGYEGSVRALDPGTGKTIWEHGSPGAVIPALAAANGFLADGAGNSLEVLDATTSQRLFSYATGAPIYAAPSIVDGRIFVAGTDGTIYTFGLPNNPPPTPLPDPNCPSGWTCQDVGGAAPAGSDSVSSGTWSVTAGGSGVSGSSDQFRFVDQSASGDSRISAQVTSFQSGSSGQAGLMIRQSTDPLAPYYAVFLTGSGNLTVQYRLTSGNATITATQSSATLPLYLRIQRTGDQFLTGTSTDGVNYALVPGTTATVLMPNAVLEGAAVSSSHVGTPATAGFSSVAIAAPTSPPASPTPATACPSGWTCGDIGNPVIVGNQSLSGGAWTVQGAGVDIWTDSDQFHFVWQSLTGDGGISAHVTAQTNTGAWAKGGVMMRQSTALNAAYYAVFVTPGNGIAVQARLADGYDTSSTTILGSVPAYLRITRAGNTFSAYTSGDGTNWTLIPQSSTTLSVGTGMLAGMAVTAHNGGALSTVAFDTVRINSAGQPTATATPTATGGGCPSGWNCADVGAPAFTGNQSLSGNTWSVQGSGYDIWNADDQFHYVWQSLVGDGSISAHMAAQTNTDPWAKAGVMIRGSTDPAAPFYALFVTPGNGIVVDYRGDQGDNAVQAATLPSGGVPTFLKVTRLGATFSAYTSSDGTNWTLVPGSGITLSVTGSMLAGLAVTAHNSGALSTAAFDSVNFNPTQQPTATPTATTPPSTSTLTPTPVVGTACPTGWACSDVGSPAITGGQSLNGNVWTVQGSGYDVWYADDQFHYVQRSLAGDGSVSAHVTTQSISDPWAKAGVMLRGSTDPGAPFYALFVTPSNGLVVDYRSAQGAAAIQAAPTLAGAVPSYLRVTRQATSFTAYISSDGVNWTLVPGSGATLNVNGSLLAGLAVTSHDRTAASTVTFDSVAIAATAPPTATPTATALSGPCPSGWSCSDVGAPDLKGGQTINGNAWTIQGSGYDIWYADDQFHYVRQTLPGDGSVSAHVISQTNSDPWAKAGVMLRGSTDPGAPFYAIFVTPSNGIVVDYRSAQGAAAVQVVPTLAGAVPAYLRVTRTGSSVNAYTSGDGINWTLVPGSGATLSVGGSLLAGPAVTSHDRTTSSIVTFDSVAVTTAPAPSATASATSTATPTGTATAQALTPTPTSTSTMSAATPTPSPSGTGGSCPSGWSCADVGAPNLVGGQSLAGNVWAVRASGYDIWNADDQFHYVWQALTADGNISAHVTSQINTDPWAKAGVMLRGSVDPGAPFYALFVTPGNGIVVDYRAGQDSAAIQAAQVPPGAVPAYLRVTRTGTTFSAYTSNDGSNWTLIPGSAGTLSVSGDLMAGLAVTSHNNGALSAADFDSVQVVP